jgi:DNA-directed RNA polymerase specialized sigma24 family protein
VLVEDDLGDVHAGEYAGATPSCNLTGRPSRTTVDTWSGEEEDGVRADERHRRDAEFTAFAAASFPALRRTAFLMVADWHLAEDVVQAALIGMYRQWDRIEQSYGPGPYARRAVVNAAISELRRPHRRENLTGEPPERPSPTSQAARGLATLRRHLAPVPTTTEGAAS